MSIIVHATLFQPRRCDRFYSYLIFNLSCEIHFNFYKHQLNLLRFKIELIQDKMLTCSEWSLNISIKMTGTWYWFCIPKQTKCKGYLFYFCFFLFLALIYWLTEYFQKFIAPRALPSYRIQSLPLLDENQSHCVYFYNCMYVFLVSMYSTEKLCLVSVKVSLCYLHRQQNFDYVLMLFFPQSHTLMTF